MTIVNFGYEKKIITPDELLSLKEEPFVILDTTILNCIIPHRIGIRKLKNLVPYKCQGAILKVMLGELVFGEVNTIDFLDILEDQFILINVNNCNPKPYKSVLGYPLTLVNDGEELLNGDAVLEIHAFYSDIGQEN